MKKNWGVILLLISIVLTTIGSVLKIMRLLVVSEVLLWVGVILFVVAIGIIILNLMTRNKKIDT